jgi:hypothetical protein
MKIKEIRYGRKFFLGNYETETIEVAVELDGEDPTEMMKEAQLFVGAHSAIQQAKVKIKEFAVSRTQKTLDLGNQLKQASDEARSKAAAKRKPTAQGE